MNLFSIARTVLAAVLFEVSVSTAEAGIRIYLLRHAEAGRNMEKNWKDIPKDEWPDYNRRSPDPAKRTSKCRGRPMTL
jgi:hypothetical protein